MEPSPSPPAGRPLVAILAIAVALVAGLATPWFLDYDEAAYADVAHHMCLSGDWLRPVSNCQPFLEKPLPFFWLVAVMEKLVGLTPLAPRLVSAVALLLGLTFVAREVVRGASPQAAEAVTWVAGGALMPFTLGRVGLLDALVMGAVAVALLAFLRGLGEENPRRRRLPLATAYAATGIALAVKGPAFPFLVGGILLADALVRRDVTGTLRRSGIAWGLPLVLLVGLPPFVLAVAATGPAFLAEFLGEHNIGRILAPMQGHRGSPLYYVAVLAVGLLPFSAFLPWALLRVRHLDPRSRRMGSFAAVWGLVVVAAFSLAATKLPGYVAPAVPALAIVMGLTLVAEHRGGRIAWHFTLAVCAGSSLVIASLPHLLARLPALLGAQLLLRAPELTHLPQGPWPRLGFLVSAVLLALGAVSAWALARGNMHLKAVRTLGLAGTLAWATLLISAGDLLGLATINPVRNLAAIAASELPPGAPIHAVEMNHRITLDLASGRCTVFLRARTPAERQHVREVLAHDGSARIIMADTWWETLRPLLEGHVLARDGAYVLVTGEHRAEQLPGE
jgi:4-amino-4-deoxy-L-arabinose transferase-like glycosyltransferase